MSISCVLLKEVYYFLVMYKHSMNEIRVYLFLARVCSRNSNGDPVFRLPACKNKQIQGKWFSMIKIVLKTVLIFKNLLSNSLSNSVICTFPAYELDYVVSYNDLVSELPCLYIGQYILIFTSLKVYLQYTKFQ